MEIKQVIKNGNHFDLCVVKLPDVHGDVYGIVNKQYGVCELSTSIISNARSMFKRFEEWEETPDAADAVMPDLEPGMLS